MHVTLLVDLVSGLDKSIQHYISKAISSYGKQNFIKYDFFFPHTYFLNNDAIHHVVSVTIEIACHISSLVSYLISYYFFEH